MKRAVRFPRVLTATILCLSIFFGMVGCGAGGQPETALDPDSPAEVTVWNYYNGDQLAAFDSLVDEFNGSVGLEKGIVVAGVSQGDINTLADALIASVKGESGAQETPTLAAVYAETAYILDKAGALEPLDGYFTGEELADYVPGFVDEGRFNAQNELLLFPILKSTEIFTANATDWAPFAAETGITLEGLGTKEALTEAAEAYYLWTDAQTPGIAEDGKALYGRDSVANYIFVGCRQLGHELFSLENGVLGVDMDRDTFKTLWDNYYIPFINGYFGAYAKFRSEDCKTGRILALTSSSSSVGYLPTAVTLEDDSTHDISTYMSAELPFAKASVDAVVQQGASYCLLKGTEAQQEGAVEFLKWCTEPERNMKFAMMSGYSPVTMSSNSGEAISDAYGGDTGTEKGRNMLNALLIGAEVFTEKEPYASKPFDGSKEARAILGDALEQIAIADREAVVAAIAAGASREQAVAPYVTDEYFDSWFDGLCQQIGELTGK